MSFRVNGQLVEKGREKGRESTCMRIESDPRLGMGVRGLAIHLGLEINQIIRL